MLWQKNLIVSINVMNLQFWKTNSSTYKNTPKHAMENIK